MNMFYKTDDGKEIEYYLQTDPPEAMYWSTYRLKLTHIKLKTKCNYHWWYENTITKNSQKRI